MTAKEQGLPTAEQASKEECWVASNDYMLGWNDCRERALRAQPDGVE